MVINSLTLFVLFQDDIRIYYFRKSADYYFDILSITAVILFIFEIVATSLTKRDYFKSFFFYLDILSTMSLIFDIQILFSTILSTKVTKLGKAGKASKIGTK